MLYKTIFYVTWYSPSHVWTAVSELATSLQGQGLENKILFSFYQKRMRNSFLPISCMCEREHSEHFPNVIMVARLTVKSFEGEKLDLSFTARFNNTMCRGRRAICHKVSTTQEYKQS